VRAVVDGAEMRLGSAGFCNVAPGVSGEIGASHIYFRHGDRVATFAIAQSLRPDAAAVVAALRRQGKRVILLSGDRSSAVARFAATVGIDSWTAGLTPSGKLAELQQLAAAGHRTLMVGDGLNDAPALAAAHASMSPATAVDISRTAADVVFQGSSLGAVLETLAIARRSGVLVRQNIVLAIAYNALAVPLAMAGWVTPLLAAAAMSSSSILVIANAFRLGRAR
jgi:Cu2+-exporting ATPase